MLIGVITSTLSSYPPEVRGATSGLQRDCFVGGPLESLVFTINICISGSAWHPRSCDINLKWLNGKSRYMFIEHGASTDPARYSQVLSFSLSIFFWIYSPWVTKNNPTVHIKLQIWLSWATKGAQDGIRWKRVTSGDFGSSADSPETWKISTYINPLVI